MFSLIITIISITLAGLLVLITMNSVEGIMDRAGPAQSAALIVSQAAQISGAARIYTGPVGPLGLTLDDLVGANLLKSVPPPPFDDGGQYTFNTDGSVRLAVTSEKVCIELQKKLTGAVDIPVVKPAHQGCYNSDGAYVFILQ